MVKSFIKWIKRRLYMYVSRKYQNIRHGDVGVRSTSDWTYQIFCTHFSVPSEDQCFFSKNILDTNTFQKFLVLFTSYELVSWKYVRILIVRLTSGLQGSIIVNVPSEDQMSHPKITQSMMFLGFTIFWVIKN